MHAQQIPATMKMDVNINSWIVIPTTCVTSTAVIHKLDVYPQPRCVMITTFARMTLAMRILVLAIMYLSIATMITNVQWEHAVHPQASVLMLTSIVTTTTHARQIAAILNLDAVMLR
jgi:hypothetical protein